MAGAIFTHNVAGKALVKVALPQTPSTLDLLGYTIDGVEIEITSHTKDIPGDQNGGQAGPPVDVLLLGQSAIITVNLVDYDNSVYRKVLTHKASTGGGAGTVGTPETAGNLLLAGGRYVRVLVLTTNDPWNFPTCELVAPINHNVGTTESRPRIQFRALVPSVGGVLFNTTTS